MLVVLAAAFAPVASAQEPSIRFGTDLTAALGEAARRKTVTVAYFSAAWCGWCRKMQASTFTDRAVAGMADRFVWVKIDADQQPRPTAAYAVTGLPCVLLLKADGRVLARQDGYVPAEAMAAWLRTWADKADAPPDEQADEAGKLAAALVKAAGRPATADGQPGPELRAVVERLAQPQRSGRQQLLDALAKAGTPAWLPLCALMGDKTLAVRAAAGEALAFAAGPGGPAFDPFADEAPRKEQIAAWRKWLESPRPRRATPPAPPATAPATGPATVPASGPAGPAPPARPDVEAPAAEAGR